jgi:hypothetical protein
VRGDAISLCQFTLEVMMRLSEFYDSELMVLATTNAERDADVHLLKSAYLRSGLESLRLHLAFTWDACLIDRRFELTMQRAKRNRNFATWKQIAQRYATEWRILSGTIGVICRGSP